MQNSRKNPERAPLSQPAPPRASYVLMIVGAALVLPLLVVLRGALGLSSGAMGALMGVFLMVWFWLSFGPLGRASSTWTIPRPWAVAATAVTLLASLALTGVALFMADHRDTRFVWHQQEDFAVKHNCFTCYATAAAVNASRSGNPYDPHFLREAGTTSVHESLGGRFRIDAYPYPPPFLVTQRILQLFSQDFFVLRGLWYVVLLGLILAGMSFVAHWAGAFKGHGPLLLFPAIFLAPATLTALQIENVHPLVVLAALSGAALLTRRHTALGSLLLAAAILTKMWPAVLLLPFLLAGRWRAVGATLMAMLSLGLVALGVLGQDIFHDFLTFQLPRLASGEAFGFMVKRMGALTANASVFGFWHKLYFLDVLEGAPPTLLPRALAWGYPVVVLTVLFFCRRSCHRLMNRAFADHSQGLRARLLLLLLFLAFLGLVQLRSPFLPWPYGVLSTQLLLIALLPLISPARRVIALVLLVFMSQYIPLPFLSQDANLIYGMVGTLIILGASLFALRLVARESRLLQHPTGA